MNFMQEDIIKLLLAILIGGLIGFEREFRDKAAGFRTIILICVGAALFTILSLKLGSPTDPVRIAANIVSGVGFLGAGVIMRDRGRVTGLTTSSTIWLAAALGMGIGGGYYKLSVATAAMILVVLWVFPVFENWVDRAREIKIYEVVGPSDIEIHTKLQKILRKSGLSIQSYKREKHGQEITYTWNAIGSNKKHNKLIDFLFADEDLENIRF
jgi:putative Mg2+ transporter-C (MgtC) family protein